MAMRIGKRAQRAEAGAQLLASVGKRPPVAAMLVTRRLEDIPLGLITPNPHQPRRTFDPARMEEMVGSIRQQGLLQPIAVRQPDPDVEEYVLIHGERRLRAYQALASQPRTSDFEPADFERIRAVVTAVRGEDAEQTMLMHALLENIVRDDLPEREQADAFHKLKAMTGLSWERIASQLGLDATRVKRMALLGEDENVPVLVALEDRRITQDQAVSLARLRDPDVAGALIPMVAGLDRTATQEVVREARELARTEPAMPKPARASEAVRRARVRGTPVVGPAPGPTGYRELTVDGVAEQLPTIRPANVALARAFKVSEIDRDEFGRLLQETCEQVDIWPRRPSARSAPSRSRDR